jgi:hypothetical protein
LSRGEGVRSTDSCIEPVGVMFPSEYACSSLNTFDCNECPDVRLMLGLVPAIDPSRDMGCGAIGAVHQPEGGKGVVWWCCTWLISTSICS